MSMQEKLLLHSINIVLYCCIIVLSIVYFHELEWALDTLPSYFDNSIKSPLERSLSVQVKNKLRLREGLDEIPLLLSRAVKIDPNEKAAYWLGKYYLVTSQNEKALKQFLYYLTIDPRILNTYIHIAELYEKKNQPERAKDALRQGLNYFSHYAPKYKPHEDESVSQRYNAKAMKVYQRYLRAINKLSNHPLLIN